MKKLQLLSLSVLLVLTGQGVFGQTINTVIATIPSYGSGWGLGTGTGSFATEGGLAIAFDHDCNMYFYSMDVGHIMKIDASTGIETLFAGDPTGSTSDGVPATSAGLSSVMSMAFDANDNLYLASMDGKVREIVGGLVYTVAGSTVGYSMPSSHLATASQLDRPSGLAIDNAGNVYISDFYNQIVTVLMNGSSITGRQLFTFAGIDPTNYGYDYDGVPATTAKLYLPYGLAFNADKSVLYICDCGNSRVRAIDMTTNYISTRAGTGSIGGYGNGDGGAATSADLHSPYSIAVDYGNNIYFSDFDNNCVRKVNSSNVISTYAGDGTFGNTGDGGPATAGQIEYGGRSLAVDPIGVLFAGSGRSYTPIRCVCSPTMPDLTISSVPAAGTHSCVSTNTTVTFTAHVGDNSCGLSLQWYKLIGSSYLPVGTGPVYIDNTPSANEDVFCTASPIFRPYHTCLGSGMAGSTSNHINITFNFNPAITDVDINTICAPEYMTSGGPATYYTTTVTGGASPYTYSWVPVSGYGTTLSSYSIASPTITATAFPRVAYHALTVTDNNGCTAMRMIYTPLITSGFDLATRDGFFDMYDERNVSMSLARYGTISMGPDIWNRHTNDGATYMFNETPKFVPSTGTPNYNYLYTKVRNVGCVKSPPSGHAGTSQITLTTYWTMGGILNTEIWPYDWKTGTGMNQVPGHPGGLQWAGSECSTTVIPVIQPGDYTIVEHRYLPPNPQIYDASHLSDQMELCFLTRIIDQHNTSDIPNYMTIPESVGVPVRDNITNNNNIATLNTAVMWANRFSPRPYSLVVGNAGPYAHTAQSLQFINDFVLNPGTGTSTLSGFVTIKAYLGDLYDAWQAGGSYSPSVVTKNANEKSVTFDGSNTLQLDSIVMDSGAVFNVHMEISINAGVDPSEMQPEAIHVRGLMMEHVVIDSILDTVMAVPNGDYIFEVKYDGNPNPGGVLAITEISRGPAGNNQYAEVIVANCGSDGSLYVNVQGWIFDDNTGILDSVGTCDTAHYRLAYDSVWGNVQVGSRIVLFDHNADCYNLPDTFTYDDSNHIYWIPIGGTPGSPYGTPHVERYYSTANSSCGYCSDTGITVYDTASDWAHTMHLQYGQDGVQVRCPGCTPEKPASPQFYDGVEYLIIPGASDDSLVNIANNIGLVLIAPSAGNHKYVFTGSSYADLIDATKWDISAADTAGTPPPTAGNVDSAFYWATFQHALGLPCCGAGLKGMYENAREKKTAAVNLKVYPNPANSILYFEIPSASESNIRIMDITGRVVAQQPVHGELRAGVDVKGFTPGMYIYQVSTGKKVWTGKILVQ